MTPFQPFSLNLGGWLAEFSAPAVMGILNITDDSFYAASRSTAEDAALRATELAKAGADIIDIGACSTRPGAECVDEATESHRICTAVAAVRTALGDHFPLSVDTFRASVARAAVASGANIINDISGGDMDPGMFTTVAELGVPYVLMHTRGTPATMQSMTNYTDVTSEVIKELSAKIEQLQMLGVADVIVDPGFGFAKTLEQNYAMLAALEQFALLGKPVLVGVSRKSMFTKLLGINADEALPATAIAGALALERGASILRVHDPAPAAQSIAIINALNKAANV